MGKCLFRYFFLIFGNVINGDYMKKFYFFIILLLCIFSSLIITKSDKTVPTFKEDNSYDIYILDISKENINTSNIFNYFDNVKILEIYPYINPIYKKLINLSNYSFNTSLSNKKNISLFTREYLRKLENNSLKEELAKYKINGIKINKIKIYASSNYINKIKYLYNF